jgi:hypothetical protein
MHRTSGRRGVSARGNAFYVLVNGEQVRVARLLKSEEWRERMGVEPTRDDAGRPATVLKFE